MEVVENSVDCTIPQDDATLRARASRASLPFSSIPFSSEKPTTPEVSTPGFDFAVAWEEFHAIYPAKGRSRRIDAQRLYVERLAASHDPPGLHALVMARIRERWLPSAKWAKGFVMREDEFVRQESWDEEPESAEDDLGIAMRGV